MRVSRSRVVEPTYHFEGTVSMRGGKRVKTIKVCVVSCEVKVYLTLYPEIADDFIFIFINVFLVQARIHVC